MNEEEKSLIIDFMLDRMSESAFRDRYPVRADDPHYVLAQLEAAHQEGNDADQVECALLLGFHFDLFSPAFTPVLCNLLSEPWHTSHENIALALQKIQDPRSVDCLYEGARADFNYLSFDDSRALAVKCMHALRDIGTVEARDRLQRLQTADHDRVQRTARKLLRELEHGDASGNS